MSTNASSRALLSADLQMRLIARDRQFDECCALKALMGQKLLAGWQTIARERGVLEADLDRTTEQGERTRLYQALAALARVYEAIKPLIDS